MASGMASGKTPKQPFEKNLHCSNAGGVGKYSYDNVNELKKSSEALVSFAKKKKMSY